GSTYVENYVRRALRPRLGQVVAVRMDGNQPRSLQVVDVSGFLAVQIKRNSDGVIELKIYHQAHSGLTFMCCMFAYQPQQPLTPIRFVVDGCAARKLRLHLDVLVDNADVPIERSEILVPDSRLYSGGFVITEEHVRAFCQNVGNRSKHYSLEVNGELFVPMDFLCVSAMPSLSLALSSPLVTSDAGKILHVYNRYQIMDGAAMLKVGDNVSSELVVASLVNTPLGRRVTLSTNLYRRSQKIATIESAFLYRGDFIDIDKTFDNALDQRFTVQLATAVDVAALETKEWFAYCDDVSARVAPGLDIEFQIDSKYLFKSESVYSSISTTGRVLVKSASGRLVHIANVCLESGVSAKDPVVEYLRRHEAVSGSLLFDHDGHSLTPLDEVRQPLVTVPDSNWEYARLSADGNPIHTNPYIADVAGLPGLITHGL
ncbi:fatty acid synthase alpha subunit Lsd1, partial [Coemansia sp. RSA 25]